MRYGHFPRHLLQRPQRDGDAEREQRARRRRILQKLRISCSMATGGCEMDRRRGDAERGCDHQRMGADARHHVVATDQTLFLSGLASAIRNGTSENSSSVSKQKISATGTAACGPSVASARPGPM